MGNLEKGNEEMEKARAWFNTFSAEDARYLRYEVFEPQINVFQWTDENILFAYRSEHPAEVPKEEEGEAYCLDCNKPYSQFGLDTILPREEWLKIHPEENGLLCCQCIVNRAEKIEGVVCLQARLEMKSELKEEEPATEAEGWIEIKSESDLPKENALYWVVSKNAPKSVYQNIFSNTDCLLVAHWKTEYSHYQPIVKPNPPKSI